MTRREKRIAALRQTLRDHRREIVSDIQRRVRDGRAGRSADGHDDLELSEADIQKDIDLALLQAKTDTLARIDGALVRLAAGKYGSCFECEAEIAELRLRAVPFAVRCQACERAREHEQGAARQQAQRRDVSPFSNPVGP